jgi:hypothetical protein
LDVCGGWPFVTTIITTSGVVKEVRGCRITDKMSSLWGHECTCGFDSRYPLSFFYQVKGAAWGFEGRLEQRPATWTAGTVAMRSAAMAMPGRRVFTMSVKIGADGDCKRTASRSIRIFTRVDEGVFPHAAISFRKIGIELRHLIVMSPQNESYFLGKIV